VQFGASTDPSRDRFGHDIRSIAVCPNTARTQTGQTVNVVSVKVPRSADAYDVMPSPIGNILVVATGSALSGLYVADHERAPVPPASWTRGAPVLTVAVQQLTEYFGGTRRDFDVPLLLEGTEFQRSVWNALLAVGYGTTASYLDIAKAIGNPPAVRAVGMANGQNPVSIIVPCHRVIGSNGSLTGYGWGTDRKTVLLDLESNQPRLM
jgi:methylated-DNA-[protein]-cysteine S-methyltransferase